MDNLAVSVPPCLPGAHIRVATITKTTSTNNSRVEYQVVCTAELLSAGDIENVLKQPLGGGHPIDLDFFKTVITILWNLKRIRRGVRDTVGLANQNANWLTERLTPMAWMEGVMRPDIKTPADLDKEIRKRQIEALKLVLQAHKVKGFVIPSPALSIFIRSPFQLGLSLDSRWTIFDPWLGRDPIGLIHPSMQPTNIETLRQQVVQDSILSQSRWLYDNMHGRLHLPSTVEQARNESRENDPNETVVYTSMEAQPGVLTKSITTWIPGHCQDYEATKHGTTYSLKTAQAQPAPPIIANNIPTFNQPRMYLPIQEPLAGYGQAMSGNINPLARPRSPQLNVERTSKRQKINGLQVEQANILVSNDTVRPGNDGNRAAAASTTNHPHGAILQDEQALPGPTLPTMTSFPTKIQAKDSPATKPPVKKPKALAGIDPSNNSLPQLLTRLSEHNFAVLGRGGRPQLPVPRRMSAPAGLQSGGLLSNIGDQQPDSTTSDDQAAAVPTLEEDGLEFAASAADFNKAVAKS